MASSEPLAQSTMTRTSLFSVFSHAEGQGPRTPPLQHLPPLSLGASSEHDHGEEDHESEEDEDSNLESEEEEESVIKEQITIEPLPTSASPHSDIEAPLPEQPDSPRTERQKAVQLRGRIRVLRGGDQRLEEATEILQATEERLDITQRAIFQNRLAELKRHRPDPKKLTQYRPKEYLDDTEVLLLQIKAAVGMAPNVKESLVARMANLHIRKNSMKSNKNKSKGSPTSPTSPTDQLLNAVQIPSGLDYESKYAESVHSSLKSFVVVSRKALPVHMMPSVPEDSELDSSTLRRAAAVKRYDKHGQGGERYPRMSHEHEISGEYDRHRSVDPEAVTELLPPEVDSGRPKRDREREHDRDRRDDRHKSRRDRDRYKDDYYDRDRDRERRHRRDRERSDDPNYVDDRDRDKDRSRRERRKRDKYKEREPEDGEEKQGDKPEDGGDGEPADGEHAERPRDRDRKRSRRDGRDRRRDRYYDYDKEYEERRRREKEERRERRRKEREEEEHRISTQHEGGAEGEPFHAEGGDVATQEFHDAPEPQSGPEHGEHDHSEEPTSAGGLERSDSGLHRHGSSRKKRDSEAHDQGSDKEPDQPDPNPADEDGGKVKEHERDRDRERDREKDRDRKDKYRDRDRDRDRDRPRRHRRDYDYDRDRDRDRDRKYRDDDYERHRSSRRHRDYPEDDDHHRSSRRHRSDRERERDRERDREQPSSSSKRHSRDREYERGPDGEVPADPNYSRHRRRREDVDRQPSSSDYLQPGFGGVGREADPGIPLGAHAQAPTFIGYPESINAGFDSMPKRHHRSRSDNVRPSKHDQQEA